MLTTLVHGSMSASWQAVFFTIAVVAFVIAAILTLINRPMKKPYPTILLYVGLAVWVFVACWNAWAAA